jgi:hypothetical protein
MIALGYPGDAGLDIGGVSAPVWGLLSSIPFVYILYVLFIELGKSLSKQSKQVQRRIKELRLLLLATWGVYPLAFIANMNATGFEEQGFVLRETGYTIADILAKCLFGLMIFSIARMKSVQTKQKASGNRRLLFCLFDFVAFELSSLFEVMLASPARWQRSKCFLVDTPNPRVHRERQKRCVTLS